MKQASLILTLLDDVVLSQRNATTGGHETLDFIPGATLHGCAAACLYDRLAKHNLAAKVFHEGLVRFGNALPVSPDGQRAWPAPLCWHANKANPEGAAVADGRWNREHIFNLAAEADPLAAGLVHSPFQPRGLREGYVTECGRHISPKRQFRMMTAIGDDGRVADGQLFGYQSLREGQIFEAWLRFDDGVSDELANQVLESLCAQTLRIGRSKASHYGRVQASSSGLVEWHAQGAESTPGTVLTMWLLSDAALRDAWGQPTLVPDAAALGLAEAELLMERSFLRSRQYSPWNGYRRMAELERQVLVAGSVITLRLPHAPSAQTLQSLAWRGIGTLRGLGLGEVAVNPALLQTFHPNHANAAAATTSVQKSKGLASPAVLEAASRVWLQAVQARAGRARYAAHADDWVRDQLLDLCKFWLAVRRHQALGPEQQHGPGGTQWGALGWALDRAESWHDVRAVLLEGSDAVVRPDDAQWGKPEHGMPVRTADGTLLRRGLRDWLADAMQLAGARWPGDAVAGMDALKRLFQEVRRRNLWSGQRALEVEIHRLEQGLPEGVDA